MDDYERFFQGKPHAGATFNLGVIAVYWPYIHPCHAPRDQWVLLHQDGTAEVVGELPPGYSPTEKSFIGTMPGIIARGYAGVEVDDV